MALVQSTFKLQPGEAAPAFTLPDAFGVLHSLRNSEQKPVLVVFWCNHCPYVKHLKAHFSAFAKEQQHSLDIYAINSNDRKAYPDDSIEQMQSDIETFGYTFPYLVDEDQTIAKAYDAACTPDFYLLDKNHRLYYMGQYDDTRPNQGRHPTASDLLLALTNMREGKAGYLGHPASGCNIKWKI